MTVHSLVSKNLSLPLAHSVGRGGLLDAGGEAHHLEAMAAGGGAVGHSEEEAAVAEL